MKRTVLVTTQDRVAVEPGAALTLKGTVTSGGGSKPRQNRVSNLFGVGKGGASPGLHNANAERGKCEGLEEECERKGSLHRDTSIWRKEG